MGRRQTRVRTQRKRRRRRRLRRRTSSKRLLAAGPVLSVLNEKIRIRRVISGFVVHDLAGIGWLAFIWRCAPFSLAIGLLRRAAGLWYLTVPYLHTSETTAQQ